MGNAGRPPAPEPPPQRFATTPPPPQALDSLTQQIYVLSASVSALEAKLARVIDDAADHENQIDTIRNQVSFVRGVVWVIGALIAVALVVAGIYFKGKP